jgi:opacity protein-like surface antigen
MKKYTGVAMVAVLLTATSANAQNDNDYRSRNSGYIGISGDLTTLQDTSVSGSSSGQAKFDWGGGGNIALGYEYDRSMRLELEGGYHDLPIKTVTNGSGSFDSSQDLRIVTIMANAYYDFNKYIGFTPYIGAGLGDAQVNFPRATGFGSTKSTDNVFAYQGMAGISYVPASMPQTDWSLGYRYLGTLETRYSGAKLDNINTHSAEIGLRYHF